MWGPFILRTFFFLRMDDARWDGSLGFLAYKLSRPHWMAVCWQPARYTEYMALWDRKWMHAQLNLAWHVFVHFAAKLWPWRKRFKLQRFRENYVHEGLPPATGAFRENAHQFGRCTVCGTCDQLCPLLEGAVAHEFIGPMALIVAGGRAAPQLADVESTLRVMVDTRCQECKECERSCPEQIPILYLAELLLGQLATIEDAQQKHQASVARTSS